MLPISVLIKPASSICNMSCKYCFYCDESQKRNIKSYGFMDEQTLKNVIRKTILQADCSVYPCDFYVLDEYCLGNFNKNSLDEIDNKRKEIRFIEKSLQLNPECKICKYYNVCRDGCQRNRDYSQETHLYSNFFCDAYKMFFDECYEKL